MLRILGNRFAYERLVFVVIPDKNLIVSISGDVDEAKALSKPPEDSQGTDLQYMPAIVHRLHVFIQAYN